MVLETMKQSPSRSLKEFIFYFIIFLVSIVIFSHLFADHVEDRGKNIQELISARGFKSETHFITSPDGYILQTVRILNPHVIDRSSLKPVLLFHGFQCSGSLWLMATNGSLAGDGQYYEQWTDGQIVKDKGGLVGNTLGFVLANRGYDVWLANYRGNIYSTNHTNIDPNDEQFWEFSLDEMIEYDLPALIEYIRKQTQKPTISYIGHSQANFMMFGLLANQPHYSDIIKPFIALSPVVYQSQTKSIMTWYRPVLRQFQWLFPKNAFTNMFKALKLPSMCSNPILKLTYCYWTYYLFSGAYRSDIDFNRIPVYFDNFMLGSSTRNFIHLVQMYDHGNPVHYDFKEEQLNYGKYSQTVPPSYNISLVNSTDIALIYAQNDWYNMLPDVELLKNNLNVTLIYDYAVPIKHWNHLDLIWARDVGRLVNAHVLRILNKY